MSEIPEDSAADDSAADDSRLTGDVVIDEALTRLDTLQDREVSEHPAEFEQIHRVLRDSLAGNRVRDESPPAP